MYIKGHPEGTLLNVIIQPNSSCDKIVGVYQDCLKIKIATPPTEGKANAAIISFLSKKLGVPKSTITIISGLKNRKKTLLIKWLSPEKILKILG